MLCDEVRVFRKKAKISTNKYKMKWVDAKLQLEVVILKFANQILHVRR